MYNRITIVGRCVASPELRYTKNGNAICTFTLAVDRARKDQDGNKVTDFFFVETWRGLAENCANYLDKGKLALADGECHIEKWEKDGVKHQGTKIVAENVRLLSLKDHTESSNGGAERQSTGTGSLGREVPLDDDAPF